MGQYINFWILIPYFSFWYILNTLKKNAGLIDIAWGLGFVVLAWIQYITYPHSLALILVVMVSIWGLRLAYHIGKRNIHQAEDFRYQQFRKDWGSSYWIRSIFQIYGLQGFLMMVISLAFMSGIFQAQLNSPLLIGVGVLMYSIGFLFEAIGDHQLKVYKEKPANKGKLIQHGLWSLSRHPNYFGDAMLWFGIAITSIGLGSSWIALVGALTIGILLRFVSGVPLLEERLKKYDGFEKYAQKVPIFIPLLFRRKK